MKFLIVTQIYRPEMGALANRLYPLVREFAANGHDVTVVTGMPNYPSGVVLPDYRRRLAMTEEFDDCRVVRTAYWTVPRNRSKVKQMLSYMSFMPAVLAGGLRAGRPDVVLITSPPLFPVIPAVWIAKFRDAKLVYDIRDLWSDELVTYAGMDEQSAPVKTARRIERWGYRSSDLITVTTESLGETVTARGAPPENVMLVPNGADLEIFKPLPAENEAAAKFDFGRRFVVMYSGLFGIKHGLETLLEAAELLRTRRDICFFLVGDGARRKELEEHVAERRLGNVIIAGERPLAEIPYLIARADVCFASVRPEPYPRKLISVKIFEYLACERPVVGAVEGESASLIERSRGGIVVAPGDARQTADAILELRADAGRRRAMGKRGRRYVTENYSRGDWAARLERRISGLAESPAPAETVHAARAGHGM